MNIDELRKAFDKNESNQDYAIATDSVRAYLDLIEQDLEQLKEEQEQKHKEDVVKAYIDGKNNAHVHTVNEVEQYYKQEFKNKLIWITRVMI